MKILVTDDDPVTRTLLGTLLSHWGNEIVVASDGRQAYRILEAEDAPQLLLVDWMMPGLNGVDLCREIRKWSETRYTYIILVTARDTKPDLIEGLEAGADAYLVKPFDEYELRAHLIAGQRIIGVQEKLIAAATHDSHTGLWNHGAICNLLAKELARGKRKGKPTGVILGDLDHFKRINDAHGHLAGDAALLETARRLRATVRTYDEVGRYGGEEFLVVAPECAEPGVVELAERLRQAVAGKPIAGPDASLSVTMSLGAVSHAPGDPIDIQTVLRAADGALYQAKDTGRNRVVLGRERQATNP